MESGGEGADTGGSWRSLRFELGKWVEANCAVGGGEVMVFEIAASV